MKLIPTWSLMTFLLLSFYSLCSQDITWTIETVPNSQLLDNTTRPSLYDGTIAWHDGTYDGSLFFWDGTSTDVVASGVFAGPISLYDEQIAYVHMEGANNGTRLYFWDSNNSINIADSIWGGRGSVYNGNVAFSGSVDSKNSEIYLYNGDTLLQITYGSCGAHSPSLYGNTIAWIDCKRLLYFDGADTTIVYDNPHIQSLDDKCSLYDGKIAFCAYDGNDYEIYFWNGNEILQITDNDFSDKKPSLYNGAIAWEAILGVDEYSREIFYWNGNNKFQVTNNGIPDQYPSLFDGNIAWNSGSAWNGTGQISYATIKYQHLNVIQDSLNLLPTGDTAIFTVDANVVWNVDINENDMWLSLFDETDTTFSIIYDENNSDVSRTAIVNISGGGLIDSVSIVQEAPYLSIESYDVPGYASGMYRYVQNILYPGDVTVDPIGDSVIFHVNSNVDLTIESDCNCTWISLLKIDSVTFSATYEDNLDSSLRVATIIISGGDLSDSVRIIQDAPFINKSADSYQLPCLPWDYDVLPYLNISSNVPMSLTHSDSWISHWHDNIRERIQINSNESNIGTEWRYGYLYINTNFGFRDSILVKQDYCYIKVEPDTLNFSYESGDQLNVNIDLRYRSDAEPSTGIDSEVANWLTVDAIPYSSTSNVNLETIEKNISGQERSGDVVFYCRIWPMLGNSVYLRDTIHVLQDYNFPPLPSGWSVNPAEYDHSGNLTAKVIVDLDTVHSGYLGAFVGEECRGIGGSDYFPPQDHYIYTLLLYSDSTAGESFSFKYCDTIKNMIYDLHEELDFFSDMIIGSALNPLELHYYIDYESTFVPGWNWFSVNIQSKNMSINNVLSSEYSHLDYIKNQTQSALFYDGYGWFGTLEEINPTTLYEAKFLDIDSIKYFGTSIDLETTSINLVPGWNFVGYLPKATLSIEEALGSLSSTELDYIKNQTGSATFYEGTGWFGDLTELSPGDGYKLKISQADTLKYPSGSGAMKKSISTELDKTILNVHDFQYSGSVAAKVLLDNFPIGSENDYLYAYVGNEIRGIEKGYYFENEDTYLYPLMIYSNLSEGETIKFKFYNSEMDQFYSCEESVLFKNDMIVGNVFNSLILNINSDNKTSYTESFQRQELYVFPNPTIKTLTIETDVADLYEIHITSLNGQQILNTILEGNSKQIDISSFSQGVYFITLKSNSWVKTVKVVKIAN